MSERFFFFLVFIGRSKLLPPLLKNWNNSTNRVLVHWIEYNCYKYEYKFVWVRYVSSNNCDARLNRNFQRGGGEQECRNSLVRRFQVFRYTYTPHHWHRNIIAYLKFGHDRWTRLPASFCVQDRRRYSEVKLTATASIPVRATVL